MNKKIANQTSEEKKGFSKFLSITKTAWFWLWTCLVFVLGNFFNPIIHNLSDQFYKAKLEAPMARVLGDVSISNKPEKCESLICDNFTDLSKWTRVEYFRISTTTPYIFKPPITENLTGWKSYYTNVMVPVGFEAGFSFISAGDQPNTSFVYGNLFELIVGDGVDNRISVKTPKGYIIPNGYIIKNFPLGYSIKPNTVIKLKVEVLPIKKTNKLSVRPTIDFYDATGTEQNVEGPLFIVEVQGDSEKVIDLVGFGITDWQRTDRVEIAPIDFVVRGMIFSDRGIQN